MTDMHKRDQTPLLELRGIHKAYGGIRALRGVNLTVSQLGRVHALVGENGSGKSSLLGILSGQLRPDAGEVVMDGELVRFSSPADATARGIAMVSQENAIANDLTVAENILLGHLPRSARGYIDWREVHTRAEAAAAKVGLSCPTNLFARGLAPDQRQLVEIARALALRPRLLILDEPTSSLTGPEVEIVLEAIRELRRHQVSTIVVSHRLQEVLDVADELTVLRDGETVATGPSEDFTIPSLATAMLGEEPKVHKPRKTGRPIGPAVPSLSVAGASGEGFSDFGVEIRPGEIVGLAGLVGSGRSELLRALYGLNPMHQGAVQVGGVDYRPREPRRAIRAGLGYVPPERKVEGLVLEMSASDNVEMVATADRRPLGIWKSRSRHVDFHVLATQLHLRHDAAGAHAGTLSGGNQQKLVIAKWLAVKPRVLMLEEPTRGVDVGARAQIHRLLRELADSGAAVVVSSAENAELIELSDRIIVMFGGRAVAGREAHTIDEPALAALVGGQSTEGRSA